MHDGLGNGETEAAMTGGGSRFVAAMEAFENVRQIFGGNSRAGVGDDECRRTVFILARHPDFAALMVVFDGVGKQVGDDLREPVGIAATYCGGKIGADLNPTFGGEWPDVFKVFGGDLGKVTFVAAKRFLSGVEAGEFEQ